MPDFKYLILEIMPVRMSVLLLGQRKSIASNRVICHLRKNIFAVKLPNVLTVFLILDQHRNEVHKPVAVGMNGLNLVFPQIEVWRTIY